MIINILFRVLVAACILQCCYSHGLAIYDLMKRFRPNWPSPEPKTTSKPPEQIPPGCPHGCAKGYICYGGGCQIEGDSLCNPMCPVNTKCQHGRCIPKQCKPSCNKYQWCLNGDCHYIPCLPPCSKDQFCLGGKCMTVIIQTSCESVCKHGTCHKGRCIPNNGGKDRTEAVVRPSSIRTVPTKPNPSRNRNSCDATCKHGRCHRGRCIPNNRRKAGTNTANEASSIRTVPWTPMPSSNRDTCDPQCASIDVCINGRCQTRENRDFRLDQAMNEMNDRNSVPDGNSGDCDPPCSSVDVCINGRCQSQRRREMGQASTISRPNNQDGCGQSCAPPNECVNGICQPPGLLLNTDPCATLLCPGNQVCRDGQCVLICVMSVSTVKPVLRDHPRKGAKRVTCDRWSLNSVRL